MNIQRPTLTGRPEWLVVRAFALAIAAGALLLCLPLCNAQGRWTPPLTALFTATSAVCVTGLTVVEVGAYFSLPGQLVILALIQLGGLGIMTLGTFLLVLVGRRLGLQDEFVLMDALGYDRIRGLSSLLKRTVLFTFALETAGTLVLSWRLVTAHGQAWGPALYAGGFHAVSAFCNAGFSLWRDSVIGLRRDPVILLALMALIVLGGLGFLVLHDLTSIRFWRRDRLARGRLALHTRIVLKTSGILLLAGWGLFALLEWGQTLAPLAPGERWLVALFQAVTPRTAGFNAVDMAALRPATLFLTMGLMFIGGSPCSTAGGIKTTTMAVLWRAVLAMLHGKVEVVSHGRSVSAQVVREALCILLLGAVCVAAVFELLLVLERPVAPAAGLSAADALLFETVSAFGTVGLTTGITPALGGAGRVLIMLAMFVGRLGPLTLALVIGKREMRQVIRYPEETVIVG